MRRFLRALWACAVAGGLLAAVGTPAADPEAGGAKPLLRAFPADHNFGRVAPSARLRHSVAITNAGSAELRLDRFERSCSCVEPAGAELVIAPGATGRLEVGIQAGDPSGPFTETLKFSTNDADHPTGALTFRGEVFRLVEAVPDFVVLPLTPDSPPELSVSVRLVNHGEVPVELGEPKGANPAFAARVRPTVPGREFEVILRATRTLPNGNHYGRFTIPTSSPEVPEVPVTVFVPGLAAVVVTPSAIEFPVQATKGPGAGFHVLLVRSTTDHRLEVSDPSTDVPGARLKLEVRQPGRLVAVHVELPKDYHPPPGVRPEVTLKTNHPQFSRLRIPVVARR